MKRRTSVLLATIAVTICAVTLVAAGPGSEDESVGDLDQNGESPIPEDVGLLDCDPGHVLCDSLPPLCFRAGTVPVVSEGCWGECVDFGLCAPIQCDDNGDCPSGSTYCGGHGFCYSDDACDPDFTDSCPQDDILLGLQVLRLL